MFPEKSKILRRPIGWKNLGQVGSYYDRQSDSNLFDLCNICRRKLCIVKEDGKVFKYCPNCYTTYK